MSYQECISLITQLDQDDKRRLAQWLIKQIVLNEETNDRQTIINPSTGLCGLWQDSRLFGRIKARLKQQGNIILDADIMIASIALSHELILITNNSNHFQRIPHLKLENWLKN